jgi:hypothetical protein
MKRYAITEKAGPMVAGRNNTGVGTILTLADKEAKHDLRNGALVDLEDQAKTIKRPSAAKADKSDKAASAPADAAKKASS